MKELQKLKQLAAIDILSLRDGGNLDILAAKKEVAEMALKLIDQNEPSRFRILHALADKLKTNDFNKTDLEVEVRNLLNRTLNPVINHYQALFILENSIHLSDEVIQEINNRLNLI